MKSVTRIVQEMVMNFSQPLKVVASKINKPYPTLLRELNPYDKGAKLGVETLLDLMRVTNDLSPLQYMAEELGYTLAPRSQDEPRAKGNGRSVKPSSSLREDAAMESGYSPTCF